MQSDITFRSKMLSDITLIEQKNKIEILFKNAIALFVKVFYLGQDCQRWVQERPWEIQDR